jgi:hypothetical protein
VLTRCKKHIAHTAKKAKTGVIKRLATKMLERNTTLKYQGMLNINQISDTRNNLGPKVRWDGGSISGGTQIERTRLIKDNIT